MNPIEEAFFNKIKIRKIGWNKNAYLLYIDNDICIDDKHDTFSCDWTFKSHYDDSYKNWEIYKEDKQLIEIL